MALGRPSISGPGPGSAPVSRARRAARYGTSWWRGSRQRQYTWVGLKARPRVPGIEPPTRRCRRPPSGPLDRRPPGPMLTRPSPEPCSNAAHLSPLPTSPAAASTQRGEAPPIHQALPPHLARRRKDSGPQLSSNVTLSDHATHPRADARSHAEQDMLYSAEGGENERPATAEPELDGTAESAVNIEALPIWNGLRKYGGSCPLPLRQRTSILGSCCRIGSVHNPLKKR
jgi:hypothetical protein